MPSHDFEVDLQSLVKAAKGAGDAVQLMKDKDVEDFVPTEDACGSGVVWDAVDEFQDRWDRGCNDMVKDIEEVAGRLGKVAMTYADYDRHGYEGMKKVAGEMASARLGGGAR